MADKPRLIKFGATIETGDDFAIVVHDERFTTVTAERNLVEAGVGRSARGRVRDAAAAAVMLQSYLEASR